MNQQPPMPRSKWILVEGIAWSVGLLSLISWTVVAVSGITGTREAMHQFAEVQAAAAGRPSDPPDQTLWSPERVRAWRETQKERAPTPLAVLRIPRLNLEVPVLEGTNDWTLNRAVGHLEDTAEPGADGNSGIAGHRDGFFRMLKDVGAGDTIEIETLSSVEVYRVERTWIVDPTDVSVLDPTQSRSVTLVTCYPFYFVGPAPQRYIVRAVHAVSRGTRR